ncbi:MAG: GNAT family N-acetyltransferase [Clostridiaceae bacterium]|nr:GNAT family N-acetyltransferase [Clostridiaceae bacterium]
MAKTGSFYRSFGKRALDICCSFIFLLLFSPLLLLISLSILLTSGAPVFFKQERPGYKGQIFKMVKFRSMANLLDASGKQMSSNLRVTKIGRLLRKTSLDELPELFNILRGDMSFVGPRPFLKKYLPYYTEAEMHRHDVRPGLTGYAQVAGRNLLSWQERFELDTYYVDNYSFRLDLAIILKTVKSVFAGRNVADMRLVQTDAFGDYFLHNGRKYRPLDEERKYEQYLKRKANMMNEISYADISRQEIDQYEDSIKEMLAENTYTFHYPEKEVDPEYIDQKYQQLKEHLDTENTFFLSAQQDRQIIGYIWVYKRPFLNYSRLIINSFFVSEDYRGFGIGTSLMKQAEALAVRLDCAEISTHFALVNQGARDFYKAYEFEEKRIEVVKKVGAAE